MTTHTSFPRTAYVWSVPRCAVHRCVEASELHVAVRLGAEVGEAAVSNSRDLPRRAPAAFGRYRDPERPTAVVDT